MDAIKFPAGSHKIATTAQPISLTLLCHHDNTQQQFKVYAELRIKDFLEQLLESLARGENGVRIAQMRECYEPVLELIRGTNEVELIDDQTLAEAGVIEGDTLQIAARPLKEKLLFCRYSSLSA